jgi:hypothetical protein
MGRADAMKTVVLASGDTPKAGLFGTGKSRARHFYFATD